MRRNLFRTMLVLGLLGVAFPAFAALEVRTTKVEDVTVWYAQNDSVPVVDVIISVDGLGAASDPEGKGGRATFSAAMLTEGSGALDSNGFAQALDEKAIALSISPGADRLNIHIHCLRADAARAGELLAMALTKPNLTEPDMARIKTQIQTALTQLQEDPNYQAQRLLMARAYKGHPYANPSYGTMTSVATLTAQDVRDYLAGIVRKRLIISAAGDVDSGLLGDMLRPVLSALKEGEAMAPAPTVVMQGGGETLHQVSNLPQTVIAFAAPGIKRTDPKFYTAYLLNHILGGNPLTGRLGDEIRQKKGLAYNVDSSLEARRDSNLLSGSLSTRNSTSEAALAEVKAVLADVRAKGVTTQQCADAKSFILGNFPLQLDRTSAVSALLFNMQVNQLGPHYLDDRKGYFNKISCGDINDMAREMLAPEKFIFAVVGGVVDTNAPAPKAATHQDAR